ncbi:MAG: bifunctional (p)ppGpp synthetase/guanosine-3',5'-bis(diphosphate) 3'-pyrophosphohydrolase, partial [Rhodospirillaceae bacterium]|nr:bifunctional (p)ppGpp synthetase/guanosine-3',5'-bis(diphosphate) 3'-pyrophosphohydrolase [Rhodospirillaceae bacterium]
AMSEDIRVLLVKLADRLHNMRTLQFVKKPEKRLRIAHETMEIYAPLAERIGMQSLKDELEDLAFREINPSARGSVVERLRYLHEEGGNIIPRVVERMSETLSEADVTVEVLGREKRPYSIWRKMQRKNVTFEQLSDIVAFRVVVETVTDCYRALGVIHSAWPMVPGRFKDYISTPKPNGYRSLHTTVYAPEHQRLEIQIRTRQMHEIAEFGVAAHWGYGVGEERAALSDGRQYRWVRELLEILDHASDPEEFLEHTKLEMFQDQVFCFTPKGDLISLPRGATPVDFAYAVHTNVGDTCVGAKINGQINQLRTILQNGDQVEIVRSSVAAPSPIWEQFVATGKARSRIRRFVRVKERDEYVRLGEAILERAFAQARCEMSKKALKHACGALGQRMADDLFEAVGRGDVTSMQVVGAAYPEAVGAGEAAVARAIPRDGSAGDHAIPIRGLIPGMAVHFAVCCHPLPGDRIVGIVTSGKGVAIHTIGCDTLQQFEETPERWIDVSWSVDDETPEVHVGRVDIVVVNEPGALGTITTLIGRNNGNISNLKFTNRATDFFEMTIDVEVRDVRHLTNIIAALRANPSVTDIERAKL